MSEAPGFRGRVAQRRAVGEPRRPSALRSDERVRDHLRSLGWLLDSRFRIPGTRFRFGIEPILGLMPVAGDLLSGALGFYLVARALQFRLPAVVVARMVVNTLLDLAIGAIPFLGDLFDFAYRSNARNIALFERYLADPTASTRREWAFLIGLAAILVGVLALLVVTLELVLAEISRFLAHLTA